MFLDLSVNFIDLKVISNYIILFPAVIIFFFTYVLGQKSTLHRLLAQLSDICEYKVQVRGQAVDFL